MKKNLGKSNMIFEEMKVWNYMDFLTKEYRNEHCYIDELSFIFK